MLADNKDKTDEEIAYKVVNFGDTVAGVTPPDYDTNILKLPTINTQTSGRQWTY